MLPCGKVSWPQGVFPYPRCIDGGCGAPLSWRESSIFNYSWFKRVLSWVFPQIITQLLRFIEDNDGWQCNGPWSRRVGSRTGDQHSASSPFRHLALQALALQATKSLQAQVLIPTSQQCALNFYGVINKLASLLFDLWPFSMLFLVCSFFILGTC